MPKDKFILITEYLRKLKAANKEATKKEAFKDLLNRLYADNAETKSIVDDITLGAEKRHIHKKILDVYFPKFNEKNKQHVQLAQLSEQAHAKAKDYLMANPPKQELSAIFLGRLRVEIKKHLKDEMEKIDAVVKELIG